MPQIDLSFTITAIIALTSLVSPWITNKINNRHQLKMKHLEYEQERYNKTVFYQREILENYAASLEKAVANPTPQAIEEYSKYYGLARLYVGNGDAKKFMKELHTDMLSYDFAVKTENVELVISEIANLLEKLK